MTGPGGEVVTQYKCQQVVAAHPTKERCGDPAEAGLAPGEQSLRQVDRLLRAGIRSLSIYCIRVRALDGSLLEKVVAVNGDIIEDNFGLDEESQEILKDEVHIIFHSAATVRFDEDLTKSVAMNVRAVSTLISLAKQVKQLEALVDVSTAYANCDLKYIEEKIYPAPVNPAGIMELCQVKDVERDIIFHKEDLNLDD